MSKHWISAARPRTLFLAASTVILGSGLAWHENKFSAVTFVLAFLLAISIQVLANFANDMGDFQKGTDTTGKRQGPALTLQRGVISPKEMKTAIGIFMALCAVIGLALVLNAATSIGWTAVALLLGMGLLSIASALLYTMGKHAYGYSGWVICSLSCFSGRFP